MSKKYKFEKKKEQLKLLISEGKHNFEKEPR